MDLKKEIDNQFKEDKLFKHLEIQGYTEEQLYPDFLDYVNPEKVYSTLEVADLLNVSDNNLRYYMKIMRLIGYIKSFKAGRNYRFQYLQIYQMYLVVSILELPHHNTSDIKNILGDEKLTSLKSEIKNKNINESEEAMAAPTDLIDSVQITEYSKKILTKQYEITRGTQRLNEAWRKFLYLDSKFNLALIENEYANQLNDIMKQRKKGWFSRSNLDQEAIVINEANKGLMDMKEQVTDRQSDISNLEKELSLKIHELKQLVDEKMRLLN